MIELPDGFASDFVDNDGVGIHLVHNATSKAGGPVLLFLHGFPEYWAGWEPVLKELGREFCCVAVDMRGFNLSDAPQRTDLYDMPLLMADVLSVADRYAARRPLFVAGHDWGASVAYALAIRYPERLRGLVIANGVHPVLFQRALLEDEQQRAASQYFHYLRRTDAAEKLAEDDFRRLLQMFEKFSEAKWLGDRERRGYLAAWSRPGRLDAMLNYYRISPIVVPLPEETPPEVPLAAGKPDKFSVGTPHLLIWGERDTALRPSSIHGLADFTPKLEIEPIPDADHWLIHTHGRLICERMVEFVRSLDD